MRLRRRDLSYAAFDARIARRPRALKAELGVGRGDRVAILSLNRPDYLVLLYACARLGAMLVPLNWRLAVAEQSFILSDAAVKVLVLEQAFAAILPAARNAACPTRAIVGLDFAPPQRHRLRRAAGRSRAATAAIRMSTCPARCLIVYTSGTTGRPKGAVLRQEALLWNAVMSQHMHGLTSDDHVLTVLPFFHVGGLNIQTTPALHHGATVTIHAALHAGADACRHRARAADPDGAGAGDHPGGDRASRLGRGRPVLAEGGLDRIDHRAAASDRPASSRAACRCCRSMARPRPARSRSTPGSAAIFRGAGSTGLPGLCCEAAVIDEAGDELPPDTPGEIAVRGPNVFCEYWGNAEATGKALHDGWYRTGDIGWRDADGYFYVHDRKKNMIISGGENIYPAEVERVLLEHPDVSECGVIGRPDPRWDEVPVAYVIRRAGGAGRGGRV